MFYKTMHRKFSIIAGAHYAHPIITCLPGFSNFAKSLLRVSRDDLQRSSKVRSSYGPPAYFSDIFISGKNVVFSAQNMQADDNLNGL